MEPVLLSLLVAASVFAAGVAGVVLHRVLPVGHRTRETYDVVRLGTGMLSVLASLVLGLLIATAKTSSDNTDRDVRSFAADLILLSETLRDYGSTAAAPARLLHDFTERMLQDIWPAAGAPRLDDARAGDTLERVHDGIRALRPLDTGQTSLQQDALQLVNGLIRARWQMIEHQGPNVRLLVLVILVSWIAVIFVSFGLNAPPNATVLTAFLVCALAIGGATFLILEMDSPFEGVLRISRAPMENALAHMAQ